MLDGRWGGRCAQALGQRNGSGAVLQSVPVARQCCCIPCSSCRPTGHNDQAKEPDFAADSIRHGRGWRGQETVNLGVEQSSRGRLLLHTCCIPAQTAASDKPPGEGMQRPGACRPPRPGYSACKHPTRRLPASRHASQKHQTLALQNAKS